MQIEKVLEAMEITSDATRIKLAAFQLEGEAQVWWKWARTSRDLEAMTWAEFQELFMGKYFPDTARHAKAQEFLELKQGTMTVIELSLEVEALEEPLYVSSPLGIRVRIGMICRGCELEISGTLLIVDLRIIVLKFDVILGMDWLIAYRVVIDCERRRVTAYTQDGTRVIFQGDKHDILPQTVYESRCQGQLAGWLVSLTVEDEERSDLDLPRVVCEYVDVFPDELPGLPPQRVVDYGIELHPSTSPISMTPHRMAPVEL